MINMTELEILKYPDPFLRTTNIELVNPVIPDSVVALIESMKETMKKFGGKGLASTQVGKDLSIIIVTRQTYAKLDIIPMINPEIVEYSPHLRDSMEGCLSIPGVYGFVKRPEWVKVRYLDEEGKEHTTTATGAFSSVIQHEDDHLKGILFIDKMSKKEYKKVKPLLKKLEKCHGE